MKTSIAIEKHKYNPILELSCKIVRYFGIFLEEEGGNHEISTVGSSARDVHRSGIEYVLNK
jgi:DNA-binding XRE family transcriptional regulator